MQNVFPLKQILSPNRIPVTKKGARMPTKQRVAWIDVAKGIAYLFIVVGHLGIVFSSAATPGGVPPIVRSFAFTFHLPTFFILSGYFFHEDKGVDATFLKKNFFHLIVPYMVTCIFIIIGCTIAGQLRSGTGESEFIRWTQAALWGAGDRRDVALWQVERIGGIWFLLALFWAQLLIALTHRFSRPVRFSILCCFMALGVYTNHLVWLPLSIQSGFGCALYLYIGMLVKKYGLLERGGLKIWMWLIIALLWAVVIKFGGYASIAMGDYPLGILDVLGGIAGCACICALSRMIDQFAPPLSNCLQLIGRNTLPLFSLHILEDNVLAWGQIGILFSTALGGMGFTWIILLVVRLAIDVVLSGCAYMLPCTRDVFFPSVKRAKNDHSLGSVST